MRSTKSSKFLKDLLQVIRNEGRLEPEQVETLERAINRLEHELKVGTRQSVSKAVADVARVFIR